MNRGAINNSPNFNAPSRRRAAPNVAKSAGNDADKITERLAPRSLMDN
jgi:hypothetical protein